MAKAEKIYDEDDTICVDCIENYALRELVRGEGHSHVCVVCGKKKISISIKNLAAIVDPYIRKYFELGPYERRYGSDDSYWEEQQGEDLSSVVQELIGQYFDFDDALIDALIEHDPADIRDGEEPFYSSETNYVETRIHVGDLYAEWFAIRNELREERRYFSDRARKFFDWLFAGIEDLWLYEPVHGSKRPEQAKVSVIREWPTGTVLYRARRADTPGDYTRLVLNPAVELAPPPSQYARIGRMNAEGVSVFYGALDAQTCLAELRTSIGGYTVLGSFETTKPLRVLDFSRLDAHWDSKHLSFFQNDFDEQVTRRKFRRQLHKLISEPVIPGHESEYLMTQVLAEYLAYVRDLDGLLFASAQHKEGMNVVLFPKHADPAPEGEGTLGRFPLRFLDDSAEIFRTRGIKYDIPRVDFFVSEDRVYLHDDEHYDNDD